MDAVEAIATYIAIFTMLFALEWAFLIDGDNPSRFCMTMLIISFITSGLTILLEILMNRKER